MKAIVYEGGKDVRVGQVADPKIQDDGNMVVNVTSAAICGSDLHLIHGRGPAMNPGFVLGNETMGIVEAAGKSGYGVSCQEKQMSVAENDAFPVLKTVGKRHFLQSGLWCVCKGGASAGERNEQMRAAVHRGNPVQAPGKAVPAGGGEPERFARLSNPYVDKKGAGPGDGTGAVPLPRDLPCRRGAGGSGRFWGDGASAVWVGTG